jgi:hypothetical protein
MVDGLGWFVVKVDHGILHQFVVTGWLVHRFHETTRIREVLK